MGIVNQNRTVKYNGMLNIPLSTYTTTLNFISGWQFANAYSNQVDDPVAHVNTGSWDTTNSIWTGCKGMVLDFYKGTTFYTLGTFTTSNGNFFSGVWQNGFVSGRVMKGIQGQLQVGVVQGYLQGGIETGGGPYVFPFNPFDVLTVPAGTNNDNATAYAPPFIKSDNYNIINWVQAANTIKPTQCFFPGGPFNPYTSPPFSYAFGNFIYSGLFDGSFFWHDVSPLAGSPRAYRTTWNDNDGDTILFTLDFQSPDGVFDMNALYTAGTSINHTSNLGMIGGNIQPQTINGTIYNGIGYLVSPDKSSYILLNIIPQDSTANLWRTQGGAHFKLDKNNVLFIKSNNNSTNLYAAILQPQITRYFDNRIPAISVPHHPALIK